MQPRDASRPTRPPIEQACYWLARRGPRSLRPALTGRQKADVAVIGAGLTGLWTAIRLKELEPGLEVVVLERECAAYGASGRNAGILGDSVDHSHGLAISHFGREEAARLALLGRANVAEMTGFLAARGIDCGLERTGTLHVALREAHLEELREDVACARSLGIHDFRLMGAEETRSRLRSPLYVGALLNPSGAILDPVRLVEGLAAEAERVGVRIFEASPVSAIVDDAQGLLLRSSAGELLTRRAVQATSAYSHQLLPWLRHRFIPLYDYVLVSEPLRPEQRKAMGWSGREGVTDVRTFFNYYRLTSDNRVLWGTSEAAYFSGNRADASCDHSERHYLELRESFARHFPDLGELEWPYAWGGAICATTRMTPFFGSAHGGRLLYGLGFTGHGLGTTHLAGRILAHLALARPSPLLDLALVRRPPFPYPPEPARTWAVNAVTRALRRVDAGRRPSPLLRVLDALGIGLSS
ncbi:MAG TPA: FAD-dependent oxidoreductase [Vicinamibacteria bacterium]